MNRRRFLGMFAAVGAGGALTSACGGGRSTDSPAAPVERTYRIGHIQPGVDPEQRPPPPLLDALRELGYREGENVTFVSRVGNAGNFNAVAADVAAAGVDLILAANNLIARAALAATTTTPIVARFNTDPVAERLIASYARPGGNLTGVIVPGLHDKRMQLLRETVPRIDRVGFLTQRGTAGFEESYRAIDDAARALTLRLELLNIPLPTET